VEGVVMRDIKFRAWCPEQNRMFTKVLVGNTVDKDTDDYTAHCIYRDGDWYHTDELDSTVFMQYTELKDANGVEIYDGDFLVVRHRKGEYLLKEKPALVYFSDGAFQFELLSESREMFLFEACSSNASSAISHKCEVVGNIYENPEFAK
jgi:uncharacterized phage protein (TIGR01671 family)